MGSLKLTLIFLIIFAGVFALSEDSRADWVPPIGISHPGDWFLQTGANNQLITAGGVQRTFSGAGTAESPVVFQGAGNPIFTGQVVISGSYVIVDGIEVNGGTISFNGDHLELRNSEVHNYNPGRNSAAISTGASNNIVIYKNKIHNNGDPDSAVEIDVHGVSGGSGTQSVWIIDNEIYRNGGDSVQFGHNANNTISNIYIGRNIMHEDRENAVDIKEVTNSVISQNTMYGYRPTNTSEGAAVVPHYCSINSNVIFNSIYDSQIGISVPSQHTDCPKPVDILIIGNIFRDILGSGIQGWGSGKALYITNNTFFNVAGAGINIDNLNSLSVIENNILRNIFGNDVMALGAVIRNNLGDTTDPQFIDLANNNFHLRTGSPAIDAGFASPAYSDYQTSFGTNIAVDYDGIPRPQGSAWDIGAYEYVSGGGDTTPPIPPQGLIVN